MIYDIKHHPGDTKLELIGAIRQADQANLIDNYATYTQEYYLNVYD